MGVQVSSGFRGDRVDGAVIVGVTPGKPADTAGIAPGVVITAVNGSHVSSPSSLTTSLLTRKPGDTVTITYADQSGTSHAVKLKLGSGPPQ